MFIFAELKEKLRESLKKDPPQCLAQFADKK